ncbi:RNA pseudouridine synthase [Corynebacterium diphtheriae]|nr:RNA pseudouridine synthase [Corynebacterium diphtheriae]
MGSRVVGDPTGTPTRTMARRLGEGVVELQPATGHTHQLRILLAWLGCPSIGDDTYPVDRRRRIYDFSKKLELYATSLEFVDPVSNVTRRFARG